MNEEKVKKILEKCDSMLMIDEPITDHYTFKKVFNHLRNRGLSAITFRVYTAESLALTQMISLAIYEKWTLNSLHITQYCIFGVFHC